MIMSAIWNKESWLNEWWNECRPGAVALELKLIHHSQMMKISRRRRQLFQPNLKAKPSLAAVCSGPEKLGLERLFCSYATIPTISIHTAVYILPTAVISLGLITTTTSRDASQLIQVFGYCFEESSDSEQADSQETLLWFFMKKSSRLGVLGRCAILELAAALTKWNPSASTLPVSQYGCFCDISSEVWCLASGATNSFGRYSLK